MLLVTLLVRHNCSRPILPDPHYTGDCKCITCMGTQLHRQCAHLPFNVVRMQSWVWSCRWQCNLYRCAWHSLQAVSDLPAQWCCRYYSTLLASNGYFIARPDNTTATNLASVVGQAYQAQPGSSEDKALYQVSHHCCWGQHT